MTILGIETSCDDTGIAIIKCNKNNCEVLSNVVSSQIEIHAPFGGIVPNLAGRAHLKNIKPCLKQALKKAKNPEIDLIAVTIGPGLIPSLLVGVNFAKALAYAWQKPIIGINHIEGHIYANWINRKSSVEFPAICITVSGGHTQLTLMKGHNKYQTIGQTRDDAAGEAFDKVAKLLNLGYPGGPIISKKAEMGDVKTFDLPRPMINSKDFDFSFSGLKTAVLYLVKKLDKKNIPVSDICACFQQAVIDVLIYKTIVAARKYKVKTIILSGGVAANQELRKQMAQKIKTDLPNIAFQIPNINLCADNAVMIAMAATYKKRPALKNWSKIKAEANLKL